MLQVEKITTITDNDTNEVVEVSSCSENIQRLVELLNDWREKEAEARSTLLLHQSAIKRLTAEISATFKQEREAAASTEAADSAG